MSTQEVMLRLKHTIIDAENLDTRAILRLDLTKAFDNVKYTTISEDMEKLGTGYRTFEYCQKLSH